MPTKQGHAAAGKVILSWLCLVLSAVGASAKESAPAQPPARLRVLFLVDSSLAMAGYKDALAAAVSDRILAGVDGQMRPGDAFALWPFSQVTHSDRYSPIIWQPRSRQMLAERLARLLKNQLFEGEARLDNAMAKVNAQVGRSDSLVILLLSDGLQPIRGTPFDQNINAAYTHAQQDETTRGRLLLTTLQANKGQMTAWSVASVTGAPMPALKVAEQKPPTAKSDLPEAPSRAGPALANFGIPPAVRAGSEHLGIATGLTLALSDFHGALIASEPRPAEDLPGAQAGSAVALPAKSNPSLPGTALTAAPPSAKLSSSAASSDIKAPALPDGNAVASASASGSVANFPSQVDDAIRPLEPWPEPVLAQESSNQAQCENLAALASTHALRAQPLGPLPPDRAAEPSCVEVASAAPSPLDLYRPKAALAQPVPPAGKFVHEPPQAGDLPLAAAFPASGQGKYLVLAFFLLAGAIGALVHLAFSGQQRQERSLISRSLDLQK